MNVPNPVPTDTVGAIPILQSPVALKLAVSVFSGFLSICPKVGAALHITSQSDTVDFVSNLLGFIALVMGAWALRSRVTSTVQPVTLTQAQADAHPATIAVNQTNASMAAAGIPSVAVVQAQVQATQDAKK